MRKSVTTWSDCVVLQRKMAVAQERMIQYLAAGCPKEGLNDDMFLSIALIELQNKIVEIRARRKESSNEASS